MNNIILNNKKISLLAAIVIVIFIFTILRNISYEDFLYKLRHSDMTVRPVVGEELETKREYFALGGSFIFLTIAKIMASRVQRDVYINLLKGHPIKEATRKAVDDMPEERVGLVLDVDGVTIEVTRFRHSFIANRLAVLHRRLSEKDRSHADCGNPEYENRMTCANLVYIPKKNFLVVVSDIKHLVDVKNTKGERIARDYEAIDEDRLQFVIDAIKNL